MPEAQMGGEVTNGRREMMTKLGATLGLAVLADPWLTAARGKKLKNAASADTAKAALADGEQGKSDSAFLLGFTPAVALGWVGVNIIGPALNQLDKMADEQERMEAQARSERMGSLRGS
jgi:hypothetical protein